MKKLTMSWLIVLLGLYASALYADDQDRVLELRQSGEVMPLEQILDISRQQQQGRVLEVELEQERDAVIYELKILADDGQVWELKVDAKSGTILDKERE